MIYYFRLVLFYGLYNLAFSSFSQNQSNYIEDSVTFHQLYELYKKTVFVDMDSALILLKRQKMIIDRNGNEREKYLKMTILYFNNQGIYYKSKSQFDSALVYYQKTKELNQELNNIENLATSFNNIANIYYMKGDYAIALQMHFESLNLRLGIGDTAGVAMSNANIGLIHDSLKEYEKALEYYREASESFLTLNNERGLIYTYTSMGLTHHNLQNLEKADSLLRLSMAICKRSNDLRGLEYCLLNLGTLNLDKYEQTKNKTYLLLADEQLLTVDEMAKESGDKWGNIAALNGLAKSALIQNDLKLSLNYLTKALKFTNEIDSEKQLSYTYLLLSEVYEKKEDFAQSLDFYKRHKAVSDTLFTIEKDEEIGRKQAWLEYNQILREKEIEEENLTRINEIQQARQKLIIVIIGLSLVLLVIATIYLYKQWRKTKYEKEKAEDFNRNLQDQIAQIQRKLENEKEELPPHMSKLSKRELEVLLLIGKGQADKEIADTLCVSITTVRTHNRRIFDKLLINNRTEALNILDQYQLI